MTKTPETPIDEPTQLKPRARKYLATFGHPVTLMMDETPVTTQCAIVEVVERTIRAYFEMPRSCVVVAFPDSKKFIRAQTVHFGALGGITALVEMPE